MCEWYFCTILLNFWHLDSFSAWARHSVNIHLFLAFLSPCFVFWNRYGISYDMHPRPWIELHSSWRSSRSSSSIFTAELFLDRALITTSGLLLTSRESSRADSSLSPSCAVSHNSATRESSLGPQLTTRDSSGITSTLPSLPWAQDACDAHLSFSARKKVSAFGTFEFLNQGFCLLTSVACLSIDKCIANVKQIPFATHRRPALMKYAKTLVARQQTTNMPLWKMHSLCWWGGKTFPCDKCKPTFCRLLPPPAWQPPSTTSWLFFLLWVFCDWTFLSPRQPCPLLGGSFPKSEAFYHLQCRSNIQIQDNFNFLLCPFNAFVKLGAVKKSVASHW